MIEHFKFVAAHTKQHAEDHHSGAVGDLWPADRDARSTRRPIRRWTRSGTISAMPTRRRCAASPMPAAAICSSTKCSSPCCAIRNIATRWSKRGDDPEKLGPLYGDLINAAMSDIPSDMTDHHASVPRQLQIDLHGRRAATTPRRRCCSTRSTCTAISWSTTPSVPAASSRCGWCRRIKQVVLGLVTTKTGKLESKDEHQAPDRRGREVHRARPALPVAAVRLRLDRGGQHADRGAAVGEAAHDRRGGGRGLGRR